MSLNDTSSQAGKRQRFDQLQYTELSYAELLEDYTETARGISFGKTVGDKVKVSSYSLGTTSSALIPVLTVRLKDGCEDKGYSTYSLQDNLLFTLKEPEIPSNILSAIQELQPYVSAIGINNSIREFRCPEWLTIRSPKGLLHDGTTSVAYYGKIPIIINCYDNGGRAAEATPNMEVILVGERHLRLNGKRRTAHLQNTVFRSLDGLKGQFTFLKTVVVEVSTECTINELMAAAAQCIGVEQMAIGIHEDGEHRFPNSVRLDWHLNKNLEFNSIHSHYGHPVFPNLPFVSAVSYAGDPMAGMHKDPGVLDHTSDLYNMIREKAKNFNATFLELHQVVEQVTSIDAKPSDAPTRGHSGRSVAVFGNGDLIRVDPGQRIAVVEGGGEDTSAGVNGDHREEYTINSIYSHRFIGRAVLSNLEFRVSWKGYSPRFDSWEPWSELKDCAAVDTYAFVANFTIPTV